jgi:hypothetical protein
VLRCLSLGFVVQETPRDDVISQRFDESWVMKCCVPAMTPG